VESYERQILAAQGYCEIGMFEEALCEIEQLPSEICDRNEIIEVGLHICLQAKKWKEALELARRLREKAPDLSVGYIHAAYSLHELGRTAEALELLATIPPETHREPTFFYNRACYKAALGRAEEAVADLRKSFRLNRKLREYAENDPDLDSVRHLL